MQNRYVGDIGDFGKYGLLRTLADGTLRLGVVWYLFLDEKGTGDGKFIDYLCKPTAKHLKLRGCDPDLYRELHKIVVEEQDRRVARIQESGILPNALYYEQSLSYAPGDSRSSREVSRRSWLKGALEATREAKVVFVDPDNGIEPKSVKQWHARGPKYVFMEDLARFYERGQSLIIYQHLTRQGKAPEQIDSLAEKLKAYLKLPHLPWALWYHRRTGRVYFIISQEQHKDAMERRLQEFKEKSCWFECQPGFSHPHFEWVT